MKSKEDIKRIKPRVRLIIIHNGKLLVTYTSKEDFFFYIGGKIEFGETIAEACKREIKEECGDDYIFEMDRILYIRDYIIGENEHNIEFYILGTLNKYSGIEGKIDPEFSDSHTQKWLDINHLPKNLFPKFLTKTLIEDLKNGFTKSGVYLG